MNEQIQKARRQEVLWLNVSLLLFVILFVVHVQGHISFATLVGVTIIIQLVLATWNMIAVQKSLLPLRWQQLLVEHEIQQYGADEWIRKQRVDGVFYLLSAICLFFLTNSQPMRLDEASAVAVFFIFICIFVPIVNISKILKGRAVDSWQVEKEKDFVIKGKSFALILGIVCAWVLVAAIGWMWLSNRL
ncbi:hypothetical protein [Shouchella hunanensis]|uniref:Uncharacterized protein n=1 Tax=Shouchella hunanensis TaxID=766894 RepID=A0ABY7W3T2_9BACI|nr:hypothetical protein [Shouchella hunanensis]WDF02575.1 hypothetical protein PQ477_13750 [Shouchella hunanensis]